MGNAVGAGVGAAITINSAGQTVFANTVNAASGIAQADTAGLVTFRDTVTIGAGTIGSTFNGSVTLDGLTLNAGRDVIFGSDGTDQVTLSISAVDIHTTANAGNLTFNSKIDGAQTLTLSTNGLGDVAFNGLIGSSPSPVASLTVTAADLVGFNAAAIVAGNVTSHVQWHRDRRRQSDQQHGRYRHYLDRCEHQSVGPVRSRPRPVACDSPPRAARET